jgi:hypothetical protein
MDVNLDEIAFLGRILLAAATGYAAQTGTVGVRMLEIEFYENYRIN